MEGEGGETQDEEANGGNVISILSIRENGCFDHTQGPLNFAKSSLRETWESTILGLVGARSTGSGGENPETPRDEAPVVMNQWFDRLWMAHAEDPARHYHTIVHLWEMTLYLNRLGDAAAYLSEIEKWIIFLAIMFHDAVYDPKSSTNEEDSANLFQAFAADTDLTRKNPDACQQVATFILTTKKHEVLDTNSTGLALFLDIDMAVLGKTPGAYIQYAALIRREYSHVPRWVYRSKRAEVLEAFLQQPRIFGTPVLRELLEPQARDNLRAEIAALRSGVIYGEEPRSSCSFL
jgi:predicted metal-dependent HD superfamily phosphohydrolase